jgi:hypothetical protein
LWINSPGVEGLIKEGVTAERFEWDDEIPGLGVRMRPGGSRNWVFQYKLGKKHRRMTLGALTAVGLASDLHAKVKLGQDPAAEKAEAKEQAAETFDVIADRFLKFKEGKISADYHGEMTRHLKEDAKPLHGLPVKVIKRRNIASLLSDLRENEADLLATARSAPYR